MKTLAEETLVNSGKRFSLTTEGREQVPWDTLKGQTV